MKIHSVLLLTLSALFLAACEPTDTSIPWPDLKESTEQSATGIPGADELPIDTDYVVLNNNVPDFTNDQLENTEPYAAFAPFDHLGRTGQSEALLDYTLMPEEQRGDISDVYPSGWDQGNYDNIDSGGWLYNRSHLIGHQLLGRDDAENLLTGTRQFNVDGMLPFENTVADYIEQTENTVMYRVTPVYDGNNALAHGVQMEAYSNMDDGAGVQFNVFIPNQQDGIQIEYATGSHYAN